MSEGRLTITEFLIHIKHTTPNFETPWLQPQAVLQPLPAAPQSQSVP